MRTILIWYQSGGPFMVPLLVVGVAGLLLLAERFTHVVLQSRIKARPFVERVITLVRAKKIDEALKICAEHNAALPDLGLVLLRSRSLEEGDLLNVAQAATLTVIPALNRRIAWLPMFALLAVLLGLLGAIVNMHDALTVAAARTTPVQGELLLAINYALRPLGAGVVTAIPLVAGYAYLREEARAIISQLDEFSARLINAIIDRPDVRLGHRS